MITKSRKKSPKKYCCKKCHYYSSNKFDFDKHLSTTKHKMITNDNEKSQKVAALTCACGKTYKFKSGLSRHQKQCTFKLENEPKSIPSTNELLTEMKKQRE